MSIQPFLPADQWLREQFANRSWLDATITSATDRSEPVRLMAPNPASFGRTFEAAVQLDLCRTVPRVEDLRVFPDTTTREILRLTGYAPAVNAPSSPWTAWQRRDSEPINRKDLHCAASCLAAYHSLIHELRSRPALDAVDQQMLGDLYRSDHHLRYTASESRAFDTFIARYDRSLRSSLLRLGRAQASPSLPGNRTADLLAGRTIVEIKTGWLKKPCDLQSLYDQLLGYGLLGLLTSGRATHVAAFLARFKILIRFPLRRLLHRCAGRPIDLDEAARTYLRLHG